MNAARFLAFACLLIALVGFTSAFRISQRPVKSLPANVLAFVEGFALGIEADGRFIHYSG